MAGEDEKKLWLATGTGQTVEVQNLLVNQVVKSPTATGYKHFCLALDIKDDHVKNVDHE